MTETEKRLFADCVKVEIEHHNDFIRIYENQDVMLFKYLIDLHLESIEQLEILKTEL